MRLEDVDVVVLGGGLAGLSVAAELGAGTVVLESAELPGGLVRTTNLDGYWFDHVLHLLHVPDPATEQLVHRLIGPVLARCPPRAAVVCAAGVAEYPFQHHLAGLELEARIRCVADFARAHADGSGQPANYADLLRSAFGREMCEQFFFPYNRKMWRRPLESLAPTGFQWNLARPSLEDVLRGAFTAGDRTGYYNSNGWYPRPHQGAEVRGMEVLSRALAGQVHDLRVGHHATEIDLARRTVAYQTNRGTGRLRFRRACVSTVPLPAAVRMCQPAPATLRRDCATLPYNRVRSVGLAMRGPRPEHLGLWRYYTDETLPFTRLVFLTNFDPLMAPADGWSLLAEVTERGEETPAPPERLTAEVRRGLARIPELPAGWSVVDSTVIDADPAYVVFTPDSHAVADRARAFLRSHDVVPLGRYGNWEYSSMANVMADGFRVARRLRCDPSPPG